MSSISLSERVHNELRDDWFNRLRKQQLIWGVRKEVLITHPVKGIPYLKPDIIYTDWHPHQLVYRNGCFIPAKRLTYVEIKAGDGKVKAMHQARKWFDLFDEYDYFEEGIIPSFLYVNRNGWCRWGRTNVEI